MGMFDVVDGATKALLTGKGLGVSGSGHNRYHLSISGCHSPIDIQDFQGQECLSTPFSYQINFTSIEPNITPQDVLNCPAKFFFQSPTDLEPQRRVYGVITGFAKLSSSKDQTTYGVTLEPRLALLRKTQYTSIFQNQSIPQIVEKVLRGRHGFEGQDFHMDLKHTYPAHEQDMQYKETDFDFVARKLAWDGIWYRFDMDTRLELDVVVFSDDQTKYVFGNSLPVRNPAGSGMNDNAILSVWGLSVHHNVVQAGAKVKDYNYRTANATQNSQTDEWQPDQTTYGVPYHYGDRYLERGADIDPEIETGSFHARLHNERYKNNQVRITGTTNDPSLYPGKVLDLEGGSEDPALKYGFLIVSTTNKGSRDGKYEMSFEAIPYSDQIGFRPKLLERPHIAGTIPARVSSTEKFDTYSHIDEMGRYKVYFDFDLDTWDKGKESLWVRLAKPYSGGTYGFHWPLLDGTEVAIAFEDGDPDRPYIAYALHDSANGDHVTIQNYKRNVLRTPSNNKMRMEDERGKEHIKLSTEYGGKTQLNMGHLVDSSRQERGHGFELRTDKWGALRAGAGLFISTETRATASSTQLDMKEAKSQLQSAQQLVESLRSAAELAKAELADLQTQKKLLDENINELKKSGILMSAPGGIAQTTPESIELAAGQNVITAAAGNHDTSILGKITMAAGKCISLFAQSTGIKIFASKGKVEVQAQGDEMDIEALKDITMKSSTGKVLIAAKNEIILTAGSAYIRIGNSQVEIGAPDHILLKTAVVQKQGAASMASQFNTWQTGKYELTPQVSWRGSGKGVLGKKALLQRETGDQKVTTQANGQGDKQNSDFLENIHMKLFDK
ncbi:type VI secretion system Vgr family protein [Commensalibacter nepenthis]|uniref:Type VI secretion system tip protein VgrG n=1 Tax=Commensalibacter nepenthis TaxID=3043872 RepID=A0ABT6QAG7_9PROT|nr:type VI secretion system Vgr family protein [Commensalibacter sp. TBRC 10068]MDI2113903.1 type VI secretion system tip protein VgrG [Commensalibacter sp. TBRC 10068]